MPERQRSLWATLDWSYGLLSPDERDLFQRLAVFSGGFSLDAVEAIGSGEAMFLLDSLVEQSLVTMSFDGDETRYDLLEPIRQYARAHLERSGNLAAARNQHAAHFAAFARSAQTELVRSNQGRWLDRLERDHANIGIALDWLIDQGDADQVAMVGWAIWLFWARRGYASEGQAGCSGPTQAARCHLLLRAGAAGDRHARGSRAATRPGFRIDCRVHSPGSCLP